MFRCATLCLFALAVSNSSATAALVFNITPTGNANADAAFARAGEVWSGIFDDDVTINVTAGFSALNPGVLGQAGSTRVASSYINYRASSVLDASSADDLQHTASLPVGANFSVYMNRTSNNPNGANSAVPYVDNNGGANNSTVRLTRANAKALGLVAPAAAGEDTAITFSSSFPFDFDPSDGITPGTFDFVGVAVHELGHALGFVSGVDVLDANPEGFPDDAFTFVSPADFLRQSNDSLVAFADLDFTADARPKFYSIDGGATIGAPGLNHWSTGTTFGDGQQASHFKDNMGLGIMDPTLTQGALAVVTPLDIQALDVIGWDLTAVAVPEPGSIAVIGIVLGAFGQRRRRRSSKLRS